MNEDFENYLRNTTIPPASADAKQKAKAAALAEFAAVHANEAEKNSQTTQGFEHTQRPIADEQPQQRRNAMSSYKQKYWISGIAAASVLVVTTLVVLNTYQHDEIKLAKLSSSPSQQLSNVIKPQSRIVASVQMQAADSLKMEGGVAPKTVGAIAMNKKNTQEKFEAKADYQNAPSTSKDANALAKTKAIAGNTLLAEAIVATGGLDQNAPVYQEEGRDKFEHADINPVKLVSEEPVSTFSTDVDTASYSFVRRQLNQGVLPQKDAVRAEEMINYFDYHWPRAESKQQPFKPSIFVTDSPWSQGKKLVHIGIKGYELSKQQNPASNLVFLLDVSGSMNSPDKLPLVKQSLELLLTTLQPNDTISIVVYAGAAGVVLEPTKVSDKQKIIAALNGLQAGGSTAGAQGIELAYQLAEANFNKQGVNRVILATDGDFNVGITNTEELKGFVERKREKGIFLSVLGFGQGNYQDALMQTLAQNGNGVAAYIDTLSEAQKVLVNEASSTLFTIAKDVKIQVEFNPKLVSEYRLIGYETRHLNREDFNNDKVDAGDVGSGHTVTAIYEITPASSEQKSIDDKRYGTTATDTLAKTTLNNEYGYVKIRYKLPNSDKSQVIEAPITLNATPNTDLKQDVNFSTAVAAFAQILQGGKYTGNYSYDDIITLAQSAKGDDAYGYRTEFVQLVRKAKMAKSM